MSVRVKLQKEAFQEKGASNQGLRTCPVPARKRQKTLNEIRKLAEETRKTLAYNKQALAAEGVEVGGGCGGGGQWQLCVLSAAATDLGSSYFAAGDKLSTRRSFTSLLETHFIDFSIFLLRLLTLSFGHPTTRFARAPVLSGKASVNSLPTNPFPTQPWLGRQG